MFCLGTEGPVEAGYMLRVAEARAGKEGKHLSWGTTGPQRARRSQAASVLSPRRLRDCFPIRGDAPIHMRSRAHRSGLGDKQRLRLSGVTFAFCPVQAAQGSLCVCTCICVCICVCIYVCEYVCVHVCVGE